MFSVGFHGGVVHRVEGAPVPVPAEFEGWRVFVHNEITLDGEIEERRFVATEMTTGHSFPGTYRSPEAAAEAVLTRLKATGVPKARLALQNAIRQLLRNGIVYPVNQFDDANILSADSFHHEKARVKDMTILHLIRNALAEAGEPLSVDQLVERIPEFTKFQLGTALSRYTREKVLVRIGYGKASKYCLRFATEHEPRLLQFVVGETTLEDAERELILATLKHFNGSRVDAAEALGISPSTVYSKVAQYAKETFDGVA
jgi:DNA-binding NtrC family response regulator